MDLITFQVTRILALAFGAFALAIFLTPAWTHFLYKYRLGKQIRTEGAPIFASLHKTKEGTPTMGGVLIWFTAAVLILLLGLASKFWPVSWLAQFSFLSRAQTLLPLGVLIFSAVIGLGDDLLGVFKIGPNGGGLRMKHRLLLYAGVAIVAALWFYYKLEWSVLKVPFLGTFDIGFWFIPAAVFIIVATAFSVNEADGLDGLAGGLMLVAFAGYGIIAFFEQRYDLAALCAVIVGGLLSFLWFNIHPARFFMGDTGAMSLGVTLAVIALLTNASLILVFLAFIPMVESASVIIQVLSKKLRGGKKVFLSAPIHHHYQAKGWPETKVTERFWIIAGAMAAIGIIIQLLGQ
ncbi:MAG: phospho-N-acetylmuramoyl-pentapeptide-transferase [Parcubacteria group bacterium]|nr:phospho-N-acetylmuramoyl-pentapeptide-transferase [Parcubacteria group bacterium]